jgi:hypothetical protein
MQTRTGQDSDRQQAGQSDGRFFRGVVIFMGITILFWAIVIALFHFL